MRVDPYYINNLSSALDQTQYTQEQLSSELSSGVRLLSAGSDPVAAGQNVLLLNEIQKDDSFTQTSSFSTGLLQVTDSTLGSVVSQLNDALALASQANNGTLNASDVKAISAQLSGVRDEILTLANTSYQGQYIFGGAQTGTAPFSLNTSTNPALVTYNGDGNINTLVSPQGQSIQLNVPGNQIFTSPSANVLGTLNSLIADYSGGTAGAGAIDTSALNTALNFVSQQRVAIDNSINALSSASSNASSAATQLTSVQTNLLQADLPAVSTALALAKSQQTALINVIASLASGTLFDKL